MAKDTTAQGKTAVSNASLVLLAAAVEDAIQARSASTTADQELLHMRPVADSLEEEDNTLRSRKRQAEEEAVAARIS